MRFACLLVLVAWSSAPAVAEPVAKPSRCAVHIRANQILVDGKPTDRRGAVEICRRRQTAVVEVDDGQLQRWRALRTDLRSAKVAILMRGDRDDRICSGNPLAKSCN